MSPAEWYARQRARLVLKEAERHRAAGEVDAAVAAYLRAAGLDPEVRRMAFDTAATLLLEQGRPSDAIQPLQALCDLDRKDAETWRRLARALREAGDRKAAIKAWRRVQDADVRDLEANQALAEMLPEGGPEIIEPLRVLAEAAADGDVAPWRRLAKALQAVGEIEPAIATWGKLLAADRHDLEANQAILRMLPEGAPATIAPLRALAEAAGAADPHAWRRLARVLQANGKVKETLAAWRKVLAADPRDLEANQALLQLLPEGGRETIVPLRALAEAADAADLQPWRRLAKALQANGEVEQAIAAWGRVLTGDRHDLEANQALLQMLPDGGVEALTPLRALAEGAGPASPQPWRRLAKALDRNRQLEAAAEAWRAVLVAAPGDPGAHERLGVLLEELGRVDEAAAHQKAFAETDPARTKPWKRYARTLEGLGQDAEAFQVWRRVAELEPGDHQAQARLADLLLAQGLKARAIAPLRAMAETGDDLGAWRRLARILSELSGIMYQVGPTRYAHHRI